MGILQRIWNGTFVYQEPICFSTDIKNQAIGGSLLYFPDKILSVTSFDGSVYYEVNQDYVVLGKNILRTETSQIPFVDRKIYCKSFTGIPETAWVRLPGEKEYIDLVSDIYRWQVLVTYTHKTAWNGFKPESRLKQLPKSVKKLCEGGDFQLVFYGDSITAGWESSGCNEHVIDMVTIEKYHASIWHAPYQPSWAELVTNELQNCYPKSNIIKTNCAAGGANMQWGKQHADELVNPHNPNLVILGFGMNSMQEHADDYQDTILSIIQIVRKKNPDCEFILVSPMIPNPDILSFQNNQLLNQQKALYKISDSIGGVCVAPVHSVFQELIAHGKNYLELTGNCINHPNDFSVRIYAQTILEVLKPHGESNTLKPGNSAR